METCVCVNLSDLCDSDCAGGLRLFLLYERQCCQEAVSHWPIWYRSIANTWLLLTRPGSQKPASRQESGSGHPPAEVSAQEVIQHQQAC